MRGEIYMQRDDFARLQMKIASKRGRPFKNPRNAAGGAPQAARSALGGPSDRCAFCCTICRRDWRCRAGVYDPRRILQHLRELGLPVSRDVQRVDSLDALLAAVEGLAGPPQQRAV